MNKKIELKFGCFTCGYLIENTVYCMSKNASVGGDAFA